MMSDKLGGTVRTLSESHMTFLQAVDFDEADLGEWEVYEPLLAGLRVHNRIGIYFTVCLIWRRIFMLFVAMFCAHMAWFQVITFVLWSLFMCLFIG